MKEPIEELFKQSLKGHEMPYNPDAWKAMNARLDVVSPVAAPTSYLKYYLGAAVIGVAAISTYFILAGGSTSEQTSSQLAEKTTTEQTSNEKIKSNTTSNIDTLTGTTSVISNPIETPTSQDQGLQNARMTQGNSDINTQGSGGSSNAVDGKVVQQNLTNGSTTIDKPDNGNSTTKTDASINSHSKMIMPAVADLCLNEEISITNSNGNDIYILDGINTIIKTIPANKSVMFEPTIVGNYSLGYTNNETIESSSHFRVNRIPDAEFTIDLVNKFENGLPSTSVQAIGGQGTYEWKAENQSATNVEADLHFYTKGEQTITLTVNNGQCSASTEKSIYIEEDYNLMAVNSFDPSNSDTRKNTFIPFALTQRDVNFVLTIIDSRDGGVVYQTSDATLPWDGTDVRSGRRSESPQVYVWKAVIINPATNEPSEYHGAITMI